jgi:hypothetical protein
MGSKADETTLGEETPELTLPSPDGAGWPTTAPDGVPTLQGRPVVLDPATELEPAEAEGTQEAEMCCDGSQMLRRPLRERRSSDPHRTCGGARMKAGADTGSMALASSRTPLG